MRNLEHLTGLLENIKSSTRAVDESAEIDTNWQEVFDTITELNNAEINQPEIPNNQRSASAIIAHQLKSILDRNWLGFKLKVDPLANDNMIFITDATGKVAAITID